MSCRYQWYIGFTISGCINASLSKLMMPFSYYITLRSPLKCDVPRWYFHVSVAVGFANISRSPQGVPNYSPTTTKAPQGPAEDHHGQYSSIQRNSTQFNTIQVNAVQYITIPIRIYSIQFSLILCKSKQFDSIHLESVQFNKSHSNPIQINTTQFSSNHLNALQDNSVQYNLFQYKAFHFNATQFNTVQLYTHEVPRTHTDSISMGFCVDLGNCLGIISKTHVG